MKYRPEIDGLRALAALAVTVFHVDKQWLPGGFLGVDVFFVLSGFLITTIIAGQVGAEKWSYADFYARRIRRLGPALVATVIVTLIASIFIVGPEQLAHTAKSGFFSTIYVSNFQFWLESGYFDSDALTKPLLHTWSLSVEEQFYFFWPALIVFAVGLGAKTLRATLAILFVLSFAAAVIFSVTNPSASFYLMPFRIFEFAIGGLLYCLPNQRLKMPEIAGQVMTAAGLVLIIAPLFFLHGTTPYLPAWSLLPCVGTVMVIASGCTKGIAASLTNPVSRYLGKISYSIYLVHWPLITLYLTYSFSELGLAEKIILLLGSIGLGELLFRFVEQRFRFPSTQTPHKPRPGEKKQRQFLSRPVLAYFGFSALICAASLAIWASSGLPQRTNPEALALLESREGGKNVACLSSLREDLPFAGNNCPFGIASTDRISVALIGDSHAQAWVPGFAQYAEQNGLRGIYLGNEGTLPLVDVVYFQNSRADTKSRVMYADIYQYLDTIKPEVVFISSRWTMYYETYRPKGEEGSRKFVSLTDDAIPSIPDSQAAMRQGLKATLERIRATGAEAYVLGPLPHLGRDPTSCLSRPPLGKSSPMDGCVYLSAGYEITRHRETVEMIKSVIEEIGYGEYIEFIEPMCTDKSACDSVIDGTLLYKDDDHLSVAGAEKLFQAHIAPQIAPFMKNLDLPDTSYRPYATLAANDFSRELSDSANIRQPSSDAVLISGDYGDAVPSRQGTGLVYDLSDLEGELSSSVIRITIKARGGPFQVSYSTNDAGNSGWQYFDGSDTMKSYSFIYDVPELDRGRGDYLFITPTDEGEVTVSSIQIEKQSISY